MPYITQDKRDVLDPAIEALYSRLVELGHDNAAGNLNYVFSCLIDKMYTPMNYAKINEVVGLLTCCREEFYAVVAEKYERIKRLNSGKVYEEQE